jgi:hypothetical protein
MRILEEIINHILFAISALSLTAANGIINVSIHQMDKTKSIEESRELITF